MIKLYQLTHYIFRIVCMFSIVIIDIILLFYILLISAIKKNHIKKIKIYIKLRCILKSKYYLIMIEFFKVLNNTCY